MLSSRHYPAGRISQGPVRVTGLGTILLDSSLTRLPIWRSKPGVGGETVWTKNIFHQISQLSTLLSRQTHNHCMYVLCLTMLTKANKNGIIAV